MKIIHRFLILLAIFVTIIDARGRMHWSSGTNTTSLRSEGNPFTCSVDSFVFVSESKTYPTDGYGLDLYGDSVNNNTVVGVENFYGDNINAIGYNVKDNYIWGYDRAGKKVVRIDDNYHVKSYTITGLPSYESYTTGGYHIGDVSVDGILHLATRDDPSKIYRVDLNPATPVMLSTITLTGLTFDTADFAFHPTNGKIYLPDNGTNRLYEIDLTTNIVTSIGSLGVVSFTGSNVVFFDKDNNFYFNNGSDDNIYKIDLTDPSNPSSTSIYVEFEIPSQGDGARCMNAPMEELKDKKISGRIFEDRDGDGLVSLDIDNAIVYLYRDNNSSRDASDVLYGTTTTSSSGEYEFDVSNGKYFVVVDSKTITKGGSSFPDIWAEQTYGPSGGVCNDGGWGEVTLGSNGACYGGWRGNWDDNASSLMTAEHVALIDINSSSREDVDFGFSFNVVISPEEYGQGSLRTFIKNANEISGANKMRFVPAVARNESSWWSIKLSTALPVITDSEITIDGTAYNPNGSIRDENSGTVGSNIKLGTGADGVIDTGDEPTLTLFNKPELEINIDRKAVYGIKAKRSDNSMLSDITIKNIAIYGSDDTNWNDDSMSDIVVNSQAQGIDISGNFVGVRADGTTLSGTNRTKANGITLYSQDQIISNFKIYNNYVLDIGNHAIYTLGNTWGGTTGSVEDGKIYQNEVARAAWTGIYEPDGMTIEVLSKNIEIYENYVYECLGGGFDTWESGGEIKWYDNTAYKNGFGTDRNETFGLRSMGDDNEVYNNHIYGNYGPGIVVDSFDQITKPTHKTKISQNSIYDNSISIDLEQIKDSKKAGDGSTPNDGIKDITLQNESMDYPVFTKVVVDGTKLYIKGYVGLTPNQSDFKDAIVEVYSGGGKWYIGEFTSDADGNFDLNITIPTVVTLQYGDEIVATATDTNGNTSEFGESHIVEDALPLGCLQNAIILNDTKNIYELDTIKGNKDEFTNKLKKFSNAIGYNHKDGYVWGYNNEDINGTFVRIGKDLDGEYVTKTFGPVAGIPHGEYFNVGDVDENGHLYMLSDNDNESVYVIDLNTLTLDRTYQISHVSIQDWAFHPKNGKLYAVNHTGRFFEIDPSMTGASAVKASDIIIGLETNSSYEGFFDDNGYFYAYGPHVGKVYRIDLTDPDNPVPQAVLFSSIFATGKGGDSTRCNKAPMGDVPIIVIDDVTHFEGHNGIKNYEFKVTLDRPAIAGTGFWRTVTDGDGIEYDGANFTDLDMLEDYDKLSADDKIKYSSYDIVGYKGARFVTVPESNTTYTITVKIIGDTKIEEDEQFFLDIYAPTNAYLLDERANGIILNDDYDIELRAVDTTNLFAWENGKISTKIVNKAFSLTLLAYNHTLGKPQSDMNITKIELDEDILWDTPLQTDTFGIVTLPINSLKISKAFKEAGLRIYGDFNQTHDYNNTNSDKFSVRPETFDIEIPSSSYAGESFALRILALDQHGEIAEDYNETNSSFTLNYKQNNELNCSFEGNLTLPNLHFQNGEATYSVKYSEVGRLDFNISEIIGREFASIDVNDTSESNRIISMGQNSMAFAPDRFDVNWTMSGENNYANILFFADLDSVRNMGANIRANIKALSKDGNITKNYTDGCLAHNTRLTIDFEVNPPTIEQLVWQDMDNDEHNDSVDIAANFIFDINASIYNEGEANASLKVNFSREINEAKNPIRFTIDRIEASANASSITGALLQNRRLDIYYGRLHLPNLSVEGEDMEARALHEVYCDGCDSNIFTQASGEESADSINWYVISDNPHAIVGNATSRDDIVTNTANNVISLTAPRLPFVDRVWYTPETWLLYDRFNANIVRHSFRVQFAPDTTVWSGKGKEGQTMQRDSSRRINQKMDW